MPSSKLAWLDLLLTPFFQVRWNNCIFQDLDYVVSFLKLGGFLRNVIFWVCFAEFLMGFSSVDFENAEADDLGLANWFDQFKRNPGLWPFFMCI